MDQSTDFDTIWNEIVDECLEDDTDFDTIWNEIFDECLEDNTEEEVIRLVRESQQQPNNTTRQNKKRNRRRKEGHNRLLNDYFSENPVYTEAQFRRRHCNELDSSHNSPIRMAEFGSSIMKDPSQTDCNGNDDFGSVSPDYAEIVIVRHGETPWNADGRVQGQLDVELNETGRQQAAVVADRLSREPKISAVYSSDSKRALETAQIIANRCGGVEVIEDPDLRERHLGVLQGLVYWDLEKASPEAYKAFKSHRTDQEIPGGGESLDQLYQRSTSCLQRIAQKHKGERVVVVSHGATIISLYKRASANGQPGDVKNTSINIFHLSDGDDWIIKTWGDVSHLDTTGFLKSEFGGDRSRTSS